MAIDFSQLDFSKMTWICMICGDERPDRFISVKVWPVEYRGELMPGASYNLKYCADRLSCVQAALAHGPLRFGENRP